MSVRTSWMVLVAALAVLAAGTAQAVTIDMVPVGNAGNAADDTGFGAVDHAYNIGKYEVTAGQYAEFLNAAAKTDDYGLYNQTMANVSVGSGISRTGSSGSYSYTVDDAFKNRPVNYVSFYDALRFTNWLNNGQGNGGTETGAYVFEGGLLKTITGHLPGATYWLPTENEWYKAAYYKGGSTNAGYWGYATQSNSDSPPGLDMSDASGNNANSYPGSGSYPIDSGKYTTIVGQFQKSESAYGTFDQAGNVWEWNDSVIYGSNRGIRGGAFSSIAKNSSADYRHATYPTFEDNSVGFRVASVPEPGSITLLVAGAIAGLVWWRRRK